MLKKDCYTLFIYYWSLDTMLVHCLDAFISFDYIYDSKPHTVDKK